MVNRTSSGAGIEWERRLWGEGYRALAGIDEVGRGAWAGPVVAAAVVLSPDPSGWEPLLGRVDDSKLLSARRREELMQAIMAVSMSVGVGLCDARAIDDLGIVSATRLAMRRAVAVLSLRPDYLLIDYLTLPELAQPQLGLPHGDAISLSIAAASIVAKVTRDRWMAEQDAVYAGYGLARHKGYGVAEHRTALERQGPCILHRMSFQPLCATARSSTNDVWPGE